MQICIGRTQWMRPLQFGQLVIMTAACLWILSATGSVSSAVNSTAAATDSRSSSSILQRIQESVEAAKWAVAKELILKAREEGLDVSTAVRTSIASVYRHTDDLLALSKLNRTEMKKLSPAFQWAQCPDFVYLNIKLAYRWTSPGAVSVEDEQIDISRTRVYFSGIGFHSQTRKLYELDLTLWAPIDPKESHATWGAVGRFTITLKKETPTMWKRLQHPSSPKLPNMHVWGEMASVLHRERAFVARATDSEQKNTTETNKSSQSGPGNKKNVDGPESTVNSVDETQRAGRKSNNGSQWDDDNDEGVAPWEYSWGSSTEPDDEDTPSDKPSSGLNNSPQGSAAAKPRAAPSTSKQLPDEL